MFSNWSAGGKGGKGSGKGEKGGKGDRDRDGKGKGKRPVFESQKDMDKWKGAQKGGGQPQSTPTTQSTTTARQSGQADAPASIWQKTTAPSSMHGVFCLTHDDHVVLEPLLNPAFQSDDGRSPGGSSGRGDEGLPPDVAEEAVENLRSLGFQVPKVKTALDVIGPQLCWELAERELPVTARAASERALEWLCSVTEESALPSRLREPREVTAWRRRQEERNTTFQTRALMMGGEIDSTHIVRIEKLGFSRAKAIEALSKAPNHDLITAVKALLSVYLPLEVEPDSGLDGCAPSTPEDLAEEAEALQGAYGPEAVATLASFGNFEVDVGLPGTQWRLAAMIPDGLRYPLVAPLLCPKHPRLREAGRPRLLGAMGEICRSVLGGPMLFTICEWLQSEGERFLVRAESEPEGARQERAAAPSQTHVDRSLAASDAQRSKEEEAERARSDRVAYLKSLQEQDQAPDPKMKDKIALDIRGDPASGAQHDLAGYDDARVAQLVREAFGAPMESADGQMVRVSFVVGGGKSMRQKHSDSLGRALGNALQELGYTQDSTGSCTWESGGTFKGQHDTQRNLKLVHVFPRMTRLAEAAVPTESPGERHRRLAAADFADFTEEVAPWTRRREDRSKGEALLLYLREAVDDVKDIETKLHEGKAMSDAQRRLYDEVGGPEDVGEKVRWLAAALAPKAQGARAAGGAVGVDGAVLSFDAPAELAAAARGAAGGKQNGATQVEQESDEVLLRRRVEQMRAESQRMAADFARPKPLAEVRASLPAHAQRETIQKAIRNEQVIVVEGDTGCGKSTQVPQFIVEDWVSRGEGGAVNILMTQPRRISAIGVAERISAEMDCPCGDLAGFSIRLESKKSARTKVLVCTTGVVLRRLENDRSLRGVTHVVVDECHERDLDTDFLLIVLRDLLPSRPNLRVVLMSATVNAQIFRDYFNGCRSISIPGRTFPVTSYFLEHALQHTNFVVEPNSEYSRRDAEPLPSHEAMELAQLYERPEYQELIGGSVTHRVLEQMHRMDPERINFDLVAAVVRHIHSKVDPPSRSGKSPGAILVFVPGLAEIKRCIRSLTDEGYGGSFMGGGGKDGGGKGQVSGGLWVLPLHSMISVAEQRLVFQRPQRGLRKVVVTTNIAETSITIDDVEYVVDCGRHKQTKYDPANRISMLVDCVETKANAKQRRGRAGRVKPGVCYHLLNARKWRRIEDFEKPEMLRVPLDSLCLRISLLNLGHPARFLAKALTPPTEAAVRSSLQQLVELDAVELLQRKTTEEGGGGDGSPTWDKEEQERLLKAKLKLTPLGTHLASLPVDAGMGKLLVLGCLFGVPRDVCLLAAALSTKSPFKAGVGDKKRENDKRRLELASKFVDGSLESDHLLLVSLFEHWERLGGKHSAGAKSWARTNELDIQTFETVGEMRSHLLGVLVEQGFVARRHAELRPSKKDSQNGSSGERGKQPPAWMPPVLASVQAAEEEHQRRKRQLLRSLLCAALWPNVVLRKPEGQMHARNQSSLAFHPSSVLGMQESEAQQAQAGDWNCPACTFFCFGSREACPQCGTPKPPPVPGRVRPLRHRAFMFGEKVRSDANPAMGRRAQTYIRDCCGVSVKAMFLLGHRIGPDYLSGRASVDGWVHCQAAARDVAMLLGLRRRLQEVLARLLARPTAEAPEGEDPEVIDAVTSMLVLDVE